MAFTNGDFEEGDLTGFEDASGGTGTHAESATVTTGAAISGTYGCRLQASAADDGGSSTSIAGIATLPDIDSDFTAISFDYNPAAITSQSTKEIRFEVYVIDAYSEAQLVYQDILDGSSPGVIHVTLTKVEDMAEIDFGETTNVQFYVSIDGGS